MGSVLCGKCFSGGDDAAAAGRVRTFLTFQTLKEQEVHVFYGS